MIPPVHRFFAPSLHAGDETVLLPKDEAEHLLRVLRLGIGDTVAVFDGRGVEFAARIVSAERRDVRVRLMSRLEPACEPAVPLTLVQAVLKGDKMDDIVRDAARAGRVDRWRRIALASVKQSRRAVVPDVHGPLTFESWLDEPSPALRLMFVEPGAAAGVEPLSALRQEPVPADAALLIGPEGGWTAAEWTMARERGVRPVTLGSRTLRADAVPVAAISILQFLWGDL
jgi:16S rRNA (uracil1498-N3)-methyltransferase